MRFDLYHYKVHLAPLSKWREGVLIHLLDGNRSIYAEAAPLPGWSKETLSDVIDECKTLLQNPLATPSDLLSILQKSKCPSVQFALESLLFYLQKNEIKPVTLEVQGVAFQGEVIEEEDLLSFNTWKVKVSSLREWLFIKDRYASVSKIRLDANQGLKKEDCVLLPSLDGQIEYIEEPGVDFLLGTEDMNSVGKLSFALDESLRQVKVSSPYLSHCAAYIIKPTLHGKESSFSKLVSGGTATDKKIVLSSSIESPVGLYQIASYRERIPCNTPWGLGTYRLFPSDFCDPMPKIVKKGVMEFLPITWVNPRYLSKII